MKIKCDYCGTMVDEKEKNCPNCGAALSGVDRMASGQPKTIEELKKWYQDHNLPPENVTRFFIGKDYKKPKAFGIYRDEKGDFVVYKNKADGSRAVRYQGADEAYAVNELYQRLKAEIADQKNRNAGSKGKTHTVKSMSKKKENFWAGVIIAASFVFLVGMAILDKTPSRGYYRYNNHDYYYQNSSWYYYDDTADDWLKADNSSELDETINSDTESEYRIDDHSGKSFEDTSWYTEEDDSGWDSDSSWSSSDSWDSGSTDWGSDW